MHLGGPGRLLLLGLCLATMACQAQLPRIVPSGAPTAAAGPAGDRRVVAADAKLFAGDYDGAEAAYRSLAGSKVPGASAHLSTLLAEEGRFQEAIAAAQAGVQVSADSESLARLTRALDWAQDVRGALQAGARAISTKPVHVLAHAFYAEALADAGRSDDAQRELRTAEGMGADAFAQAEIAREWANLYRTRGDTESELNYTELELKAQPGFPERLLDLVRLNYNQQRTDSAHALVDQLHAAHGKSYRVLIALADAALVGGDAQRAPMLYQEAAAVRPDGEEAALGLAEVAAAIQRDFNTAHDVVATALKRSPTSSALYQYLRYLDLLVLKRDPDAELAAIAPQPPGDLAADRRAAVEVANTARRAIGLPSLTEDPALDEAAQAHAYFYLFNAGQSQVGGTGISTEDSSLPGFTGIRSIDRARHFGFGGARGVELANHALTAVASVESSIDSVFHRLPIVDRETVTAGFGEARVGPLAIAVFDVGGVSAAAGDAIVYPADGQTGVPSTFIDNEVPNPLPDGAIVPAGYPVTLQVGSAQQLAVKTGRLLGPDGREVASYTLTPGNQLQPSQWAIVAKQPLAAGARYTAEVSGTVDGRDFTRRWTFEVSGK